ncbi:MAG: hypothetical protein COB14_07490 [Alphaproteobacteria bacterium]|nr:MAG: hypothetical protein COB14_07490 [Alphaproteobacteria bacterium]
MDIQEKKKEFIKIINNLDSSKNRQENFRNFCEMAYYALAKAAVNKETADKFEDRYMSIIGTYKNKADRMNIASLFGITYLALEIGGCDFLGEISAELECLDKRNGQFFTPYHLSKMMAQINLTDAKTIINEQGFLSISDPAAGAGCMILASADCLEEQGHDLLTTMSAQATELSRMTYHMLFIQLALRGIPAAVIHGNSLSLEVFESAYTPAAMIFAEKHGCLFRKVARDEKQEAPRTDFDIQPMTNTQQLNLFG